MTSSFVLQLLPTILTHPEVCKEEGYVMLQKLRYEDRQETVKGAEQSQGQIPARKFGFSIFVLEGSILQYACFATYLQGICVS